MDLPDVWGPGQLLAFSAIDGPTHDNTDLVLHTADRPGDLHVRLPEPRRLSFEGIGPLRWRWLLGDTGYADSDAGPFRFAFADAQTLIGQLPQGVKPRLEQETRVVDAPLTSGAHRLDLIIEGQQWALISAGDAGVEERQALARNAMLQDLDRCIAQRRRLIEGVQVPSGLGALQRRLYLKAASVLKVNVCSSNTLIANRWTTPDRWPHRAMFLWDSVFHALAWLDLDRTVACDALAAVVGLIDADGFLPHMIRPPDYVSSITQPPLLAWGVSVCLKAGADPRWAQAQLDPIERHLGWIAKHRTLAAGALPGWLIEDNSDNCRCGESGLDNTPCADRLASGNTVETCDLAAYVAQDWACLADVAEAVGDGDRATVARQRADQINELTRTRLWCPERNLFMWRGNDGHFVEPMIVAGFMPLLTDAPTRAQVDALAGHLHNPSTFGTPLPVPSTSLNAGTYCKDVFRGPAWMNTNYLVAQGFTRQGRAVEADLIRRKSLAQVQHWYERTGCLWEYYDSLAITAPGELDRKRRLSGSDGIGPISDYGWTAATTLMWLS